MVYSCEEPLFFITVTLVLKLGTMFYHCQINASTLEKQSIFKWQASTG